ncbi:efflux RND transporter periplasmic adaptor subunit [Roseospira goensis]|uniref:RND family efflux transporter MFP subunit n=1 Tax=Roseospira goensis TaxID=391922 RepID=A0A7W6WK29_9PROT|nr:efflux RND transporter periplasmic adaptor subunit [Roseospira goensis]MBB4285705.1 RND family efflux transporter MFP subunit [Roseospira goensis]
MRPSPAALLLVLSLATAPPLAGCQTEAASQAARPSAHTAAPTDRDRAARPVLVTQVRYEAPVTERRFVGTVSPRLESDHGFRVAGRVARRPVDVGDRVTAGAPLATLDDTDLRLRLEQAEAEARAARSALSLAESERRRAESLHRRGVNAESVLDARRAAADEAAGRLARAERAVALARNALDYAVLRADVAGVVTAVLVEPGQVVAVGQPAIRVAGTAETEALVALPERFVAQARAGAARVSLWADPDRTYQARLRELAPAADPLTRTYDARFSILDPDPNVRLGMTVTVTVRANDGGPVARLPLAALRDDGDGPAVFVVDRAAGTLSRQPVAVVAYEGEAAVLGGGVATGDWVVALGTQKLDAAQTVRVVDTLSF